MEIDIKTHEIFIESKCGLISMTNKEHVYDTPAGDLIFFLPQDNKITVNKVVGRNTALNMPIVDTKNTDSEWVINNNDDLKMALEMIL